MPLESSSSGGTSTSDPAENPKDGHDRDDEGEGDGEGELPDHDERSIANTRPPKSTDGIVELDELVRLMREALPSGAQSALGSTSPLPSSSLPSDKEQGQAMGDAEREPETFGTRGGLDGMDGAGRDEPAYTCFTPLFKLTLGESLPADTLRDNQCRECRR